FAMASKKTKTDNELDELFSSLGDDAAPKKSHPKPKTAASKVRADQAEKDKDILADLESQLGDQPARPHTPRLKDAGSKRTSTQTPPPGRQSEDNSNKPAAAAANLPRKSVDSARSLHASFTPSATSSDLQDAEKKGTVEQTAPAAGGGWWGGIFATATATASAAIKQAEHVYTEIQHNEDAKKYLESVRGNVDVIRGYGDELRHRALPTFTNILQTLAPPISSHERLLIHITHDLVGYPSLDPLVYGVFSRVMSQVEGGDLLVVQRGHESTARRPSDAHYRGSSSSAGWRDGPWWRQVDIPRDLGTIKGLVEGTKLCRVSAESYAHDYFSADGGIVEAQKRALEPVDENNPVRTSDIFLAVQAITVEADDALFTGSTAGEKEKADSPVADESSDAQICFAVYVFDPVHEITYSTVSQNVPAKWIRWLDAASPLTPASGESEAAQQGFHDLMNVPDEIREIVESGGVDPREWVAEWVEEALSLSVGIVAQRYVARRMGVGDGGLGKGKQRMEDVVEDGGGEAARAGLI
ncbi:Maintenance of telomere capping protein 1, partial [Apiospora saccharicola]